MEKCLRGIHLRIPGVPMFWNCLHSDFARLLRSVMGKLAALSLRYRSATLDFPSRRRARRSTHTLTAWCILAMIKDRIIPCAAAQVAQGNHLGDRSQRESWRSRHMWTAEILRCDREHDETQCHAPNRCRYYIE